MISRETMRDQLATLIETAVVNGDPQLAQAVYNYQKTDLSGLSPVVLVYGGGIERPTATFQGSKTSVWLWVDILVALTGTSWTEADAEDRLDDIEQAIAGVIESNREESGYWNFISYMEMSTVSNAAVSGTPYIRETIPITVEALG